MTEILTEATVRYARAIGPQPDDVLDEMDRYAIEHSFPHVGPEVGGVLRVLARMVGAKRVFEFGSGFGYSAYWFADALPDDGEVVLTEIDREELELAREFLRRGGFEHLAAYEHGDAMETIDRYDGPFDVVLIDHQKHRYVEAFEAVRGKLSPGAVVIADNVMTADIIDFDALLEYAEGGTPAMDETTRGIADYLDRVRDDPEFETFVIPYRSGISVSSFRPSPGTTGDSTRSSIDPTS